MLDQLMGWQRSLFRVAAMTAEAQQVIAYRTLGFGGVWSLPPTEALRMVAEKSPALMQGWWGASRAAMSGAAPHRVLDAWTGPLERAARSNRKRLQRRGPARRA